MKTVQWVMLFISLKMEGHQKKNITPYIHMMTKHYADQMKSPGGIKRFRGQGESVIVSRRFMYQNIQILSYKRYREK